MPQKAKSKRRENNINFFLDAIYDQGRNIENKEWSEKEVNALCKLLQSILGVGRLRVQIYRLGKMRINNSHFKDIIG